MKKLVFISFLFVILGCAQKNVNQQLTYKFQPIISNGRIYAYISAMSYGIAGNHDRIMVQIDTNNLDSNYYFYCNKLYYKVLDDYLEIIVGDFAVKEGTVFDVEGIKVKIADQFEFSDLKGNYKKNGYTLVTTYQITQNHE